MARSHHEDRELPRHVGRSFRAGKFGKFRLRV